MPGLDDEWLVLEDYPSNLVEFARAEAAIPGQYHGTEPELRIPPSVRHVNVWRLPILQAVEEEPVATHPE